MAARKKKAKKETGKQLITMEQLEKQMAEEADSEAGRLGSSGSGNKISIKDGSFTYMEGDLGEEAIMAAFESNKGQLAGISGD